jgi:amino acid transporter
MKRIRQLFLIILIIQVICFLLGWPEYVPRFNHLVNWSIFFTYVFITLLFLVMVGVMIFQYTKNKQPFKNWLKPIGICILSLVGIFIGAIIALMNSDQGLFNDHRFVKSYTYKNADATVYIYDESFLDPAFSISVRNGKFPIVKEIYISGGAVWDDRVKFDTSKDCLYIYDDTDTVVIDAKKIMTY